MHHPLKPAIIVCQRKRMQTILQAKRHRIGLSFNSHLATEENGSVGDGCCQEVGRNYLLALWPWKGFLPASTSNSLARYCICEHLWGRHVARSFGSDSAQTCKTTLVSQILLAVLTTTRAAKEASSGLPPSTGSLFCRAASTGSSASGRATLNPHRTYGCSASCREASGTSRPGSGLLPPNPTFPPRPVGPPPPPLLAWRSPPFFSGALPEILPARLPRWRAQAFTINGKYPKRTPLSFPDAL